MGTGLMVLSKFHILESQTLSFSNQFWAECCGVNRGAMWARVEAPGQKDPVDVFTCHLTPSMRECLLEGAPEFVLAAADSVRLGQFTEMKAFVEGRRGSSSAACVVGGDFNANILHTKAGIEKGRAIDEIHASMVKELGLEDLGWLVTFGYVPKDQILTNPNHLEGKQVTEDLVFIDPATTVASNFVSIPLLSNKACRKMGFTHLSDHLALGVEVSQKDVEERGRSKSPAVKMATRCKSPTAVRSRSRARTPTKKTNPFRALGRKIEVYWPEDKQKYKGTVSSTFDARGRVLINYDDGDEETVDLNVEQWNFL